MLSLANIPSLLKLLTFSHRPAKFASMMKMLLKLILNILLRPQKDSDLALENLALRQQLAIWKRHKKRPQIRTKDRLFWIILYRFWRNWQKPLIVVKPETVVRWHQKGFNRFFHSSYRHFPDFFRTGNPQPQPPTNRSFQCDTQPYGQVDGPTGHRGISLGHGAKIFIERSGRDLRNDFPSTLGKHGHKRGDYGTSVAMAKSFRRAANWLYTQGLS